jgi:hypothetical protein
MNQKLINRTTQLQSQLAHLRIARAEHVAVCKEYLNTLRRRSHTDYNAEAIERTERLLATLEGMAL